MTADRTPFVPATRAATPAAALEPLEPRRLFSSHQLLDGGVLFVVGNHAQDDVITLTVRPGSDHLDLDINTVVTTYRLSLVRKVNVYGRRGDDTIRIFGNEAGQQLAVRFEGDEGNDTLAGGSTRAILRGGDGDDTITAGPASRSSIDGGAGDDTLRASSGIDTIRGRR
jgi:Ca2+-binding RTX toxin-like protein